MKQYIITFFILLLYKGVFSQAGTAPLLYNPALQDNQGSVRSIDQTFIYEIDTIHLPFKDDFSKDRFKHFDAQPTDTNVRDTLYYRIFNGGNADSANAKYVFDTSYTFHYTTTSVPDSFQIDTIANPSFFIEVCDIDVFPVVCNTVEVWEAVRIIDTLSTPQSPDNIILIDPDVEQDSARVYFVAATDTASLWQDQFAFWNYSYPINPPTIGVATLDGLDETGYPYAFGSATTGVADFLTSKPIFMRTRPNGGLYTFADSVYLSFFCQPKGIGEIPDSRDSLVLELFAPDSNEWYHKWSINIDTFQARFNTTDTFVQFMIKIDEDRYFRDGFMFRFKNYASLGGNLDHWHIDYVILDAFRAFDDTIRNDVAFQYPLISTLEKYTSVPWHHYKAQPDSFMLDTLYTIQRDNSNTGHLISNNTTNIYLEANLEHTTSFPGVISIPLPGDSTFRTPYVLTPYFYDTTNRDSVYTFDIITNFNTSPDLCRDNDTLFHKQVFDSYYAFDDGSAEAAYFVNTTSIPPKIGVQHTTPFPDTLKSVFIFFAPSVNNASNVSFYLSVWDNDNGRPNNLIYENTSTQRPIYNQGENGFYEYFLEDYIEVSDTFYVGFRQLSNDKINVGFDLNTNSSSYTFFNLNNSWSVSPLEGTLMIRPSFKILRDTILSISETINDPIEINLYPNPVTHNLTIESSVQDETKARVYSINGVLIQELSFQQYTNLDVSNLASGMYFIQFDNKNYLPTTKKFIKQ